MKTQTYYRCRTANGFANDWSLNEDCELSLTKGGSHCRFIKLQSTELAYSQCGLYLTTSTDIFTHESQSTSMKCTTVVAVSLTFNSGAHSMCDRPTVESTNFTNVTPMFYNKVTSHDPLKLHLSIYEKWHRVQKKARTSHLSACDSVLAAMIKHHRRVTIPVLTEQVEVVTP